LPVQIKRFSDETDRPCRQASGRNLLYRWRDFVHCSA
jgi:hypothetical protein